MAVHSATQSPISRGYTSITQTRALAIGMALAANIVILLLARLVNGEFPSATIGDEVQSVGVVPVLLVTALVGLAAWGVLALLQRVTARSASIWLVIAVAGATLSLVGPLANANNTSSMVVLLLLHVSTALAIIPAMWRSASGQRA